MNELAITTKEQIAEQAIEIFDRVSKGEKPKDLAEEYNLSRRTIDNRIALAREIITEQIQKFGNKYLADVWKKYDYLWEIAEDRFKGTGDVKFLSEMRAVLEAYRKMAGLDAPNKAPVSVDGTNSTQTLVLVFDESEYGKKEAQYKIDQANAIEGQFTVEPDSTKVPLTPTESDDKLTP